MFFIMALFTKKFEVNEVQRYVRIIHIKCCQRNDVMDFFTDTTALFATAFRLRYFLKSYLLPSLASIEPVDCLDLVNHADRMPRLPEREKACLAVPKEA